MSLSDDATALDALDMVYGQGLPKKAVREKYGLTPGQIAGFFDRDRKAYDADDAKRLDGTMPRHWYKDGLRKRRER